MIDQGDFWFSFSWFQEGECFLQLVLERYKEKLYWRKKSQPSSLLRQKFTLRAAFTMCFQDKCTHFQASLCPQPAISPSMFHASFYSNTYNWVPCTQTTAKYPLWVNEEQSSIWCLEQNAIKMITALSFIHSFIHWYSLTISICFPSQYLMM